MRVSNITNYNSQKSFGMACNINKAKKVLGALAGAGESTAAVANCKKATDPLQYALVKMWKPLLAKDEDGLVNVSVKAINTKAKYKLKFRNVPVAAGDVFTQITDNAVGIDKAIGGYEEKCGKSARKSTQKAINEMINTFSRAEQ